MTELSQLVQAAQGGDRAAFGEIVSRFQDMAFAGAYALVGEADLAQDIAQEAFLEAYHNLGKLRDPAAFPGWFRRIVLGRSHRALRQQPQQLLPLERVDTLYTERDDPAQQIDTLHLQAELTQALATLSEPQRLVITLCYIEGYRYQEIADFLELPLSTVKKRLFAARRKLQGRMLHMVQDRLQQSKPSQDASFAQQVQFFLAVREADLAIIKRLVADNPTLLQAQTEWKMALGLHYWPLGSTALHLAAGMGNTALLAYFLARPVDLAVKSRAGMSPLHIATIMNQAACVQLLLDHNADPNQRAVNEQTPLHHAVLRNNHALAALLLENGADPSLQDAQQRTPMDWAVIRQNSQLIELLVNHGAPPPADGMVMAAETQLNPTEPAFALNQLRGAILAADGSVRTAPSQSNPVHKSDGQALAPATSSMLATGIKFIDLLAPLARGGQNGIFTPLAGVGLMVVMGQLVHSMSTRHGKQAQGCTVWLIQESKLHRAEEQKLSWRELGVADEIVYVTSSTGASLAEQCQAVETGLRIANQFQGNGQDVLLLVDSQLAEVEGTLAYLRANVSVTAEAAVTTLVNGNHTPGALPVIYAGLDAVLAFDFTRAVARLYPALDPVRSYSTLLKRGLVSSTHQQVAAAIKRLLQRYGELRPPMEQHKMSTDDLWYIEDDPNLVAEINRAQRLDRFLTQPFYGAEPWTGIVGQLVGVDATIAGCQAILAGNYDALPKEAFAYIGAIEESAVKAAGAG